MLTETPDFSSVASFCPARVFLSKKESLFSAVLVWVRAFLDPFAEQEALST